MVGLIHVAGGFGSQISPVVSQKLPSGSWYPHVIEPPVRLIGKTFGNKTGTPLTSATNCHIWFKNPIVYVTPPATRFLVIIAIIWISPSTVICMY